MIETFKKIAYIDFTRIQFTKKPTSYESDIMKNLLTDNFSNIPYYDLIEGFCDELKLLGGKKHVIVQEFNKQLVEKQKMIKKLLLIKEHFDRKIEVENLQNKVKVISSELGRMKSIVRNLNLINIHRTNNSLKI